MLVVKQAKDEFPHNMPSLADRNNAGGVCKKIESICYWQHRPTQQMTAYCNVKKNS